MDQYKEVQKEMNQIIDRRLEATSLNHQWNYNKEIGKFSQQQPFKYQKVDLTTNVDFTDDIRKLIYNEKQFPQDIKVFTTTEWQLAPITQSAISPPSAIPSASYIRAKKIDAKEVDSFYGKVELEGRLKGKSNEINFNNYHFNLRSNALVLYKSQQADAGDKQLFFVNLNERTFDYQSDATQYIYLKSDEKNFKVQKDDWSKQLITRLQKKLLYFSFRGAYAFRNEIPDWRVQDYINGEIDTIGPINFQHENSIRDIIRVKAYRQSIGAFCKLLQRTSKKRNNKAGEINYPRWLKEEFRDLPHMQTWLATNVIPPQIPLMSLKIKVNDNQKKGLMHALKYVFPYLKSYVKRSLTIYQSELDDQDSRRILQNTSFPMHWIAMPHNNLSQKALEHAILKSSDFYNEVIDFSYNKKLLTISGVNVINMINNNPTIKKLYLQGCQVVNGQADKFFDALGSNLCLEQIQLDYHQYYNESMVEFLDQYDATFQ